MSHAILDTNRKLAEASEDKNDGSVGGSVSVVSQSSRVRRDGEDVASWILRMFGRDFLHAWLLRGSVSLVPQLIIIFRSGKYIVLYLPFYSLLIAGVNCCLEW